MHTSKLHLRTLLIVLSVGGIVLTSLLLLGSLLIFQKGNIEKSLLEGNIAYARKLAVTTDQYLSIAEQELKWGASYIHDFDDATKLQLEAERLHAQSGIFNSVVFVNKEAIVTTTSPQSLNLTGVKLSSSASAQAIKSKKPFISQPFISASGNYVLFISHPLFSESNYYIGYVGGTIYLKKHSILSDVIGMHFHRDNDDISIVDEGGRIVFNSNPDIVGDEVKMSSTVMDRISSKEYGSFVFNVESKGYLVGYAGMKKTGWKIFMTGTYEGVYEILRKAVLSSFWFIVVIVLIAGGSIAYLSTIISKPLETIAELTSEKDSKVIIGSMSKINAWYQEAERLKDSVLDKVLMMSDRVEALNLEADTDALTGMLNRRGFHTQISSHMAIKNNSIITFDIDFFKGVNDSYGHDVGDKTLCSVAGIIKTNCRDGDIVARMGGEEFIVFLPETSAEESAYVAERVRIAVASKDFDIVGKVTVSGGVAAMDECNGDLSRTLRQSDMALYRAKNAGRNMIVMNRKGILVRYGG